MRIAFIDNSAAVLAELEGAAQAALEAVGLTAEGFAKRLCAVDTGNLRNSIAHTHDGEAAYIGTNVEYGAYVELGTGKYAAQGGRPAPWVYQDAAGRWHWTEGSKAQPFLAPAVRDHAQTYADILKSKLKNR